MGQLACEMAQVEIQLHPHFQCQVIDSEFESLNLCSIQLAWVNW